MLGSVGTGLTLPPSSSHQPPSMPVSLAGARQPSTPRIASLNSQSLRVLPAGVLPKLDLAELHRACRAFLNLVTPAATTLHGVMA